MSHTLTQSYWMIARWPRKSPRWEFSAVPQLDDSIHLLSAIALSGLHTMTVTKIVQCMMAHKGHTN